MNPHIVGKEIQEKWKKVGSVARLNPGDFLVFGTECIKFYCRSYNIDNGFATSQHINPKSYKIEFLLHANKTYEKGKVENAQQILCNR